MKRIKFSTKTPIYPNPRGGGDEAITIDFFSLKVSYMCAQKKN